MRQAADRLHPSHGAQEGGIAEDEIGRHELFLDQALRPVEVGEDQVEETRALLQPGGELVPFRLGQDQRQGIERPRRRRCSGALRKQQQLVIVGQLGRDAVALVGEPRRR